MNKNKGFAILTITLIVAAIAVAYVTYAGYVIHQELREQTGGASIPTQLSDTIGTFRTNVNTNFANIDAEIQGITSTQATYGTIATLNSPLPTANGGTGTTTLPSDSQFLSANGSSPAWKTFVFGGGILSTTTATSVQINSVGIDATANYVWTGNNTHTGTESFSATTTAPYLAPPGAIEAYASSTAPKGWLLCDGSQYATSTYPTLFALIGYTYGGSTSTFGTPNLGGRFIAGPSSTLSTTIGATGGSNNSVIPAQSITPSTIGTTGGPTLVWSGASNSSTTATTTPPYIVLQYIIKF